MLPKPHRLLPLPNVFNRLLTYPNQMATNPMAKDKPRGLGRGLSALLSDAGPDEAQVQEAVAAASRIDEIPVGQIETNPYQPRTHFDADALRDLAASIRQQGIIQPITVRRMAEGQYQLISGERRLQASKLAGLEAIPAYVRGANDEQMLEWALIENIQREDLNPIEVALGYKRLMEECALVLEEVGDKVGKNRSTVNNYLRLLRLPAELQAALRDQKLSMGHARALITLDDAQRQLGIFHEIVQKGLSVRQVEELVRQLQQPKNAEAAAPKPARSPLDVQLRTLERTLEGQFGTKVVIAHKDGGGGEIRMKYFSDEDLNRLLDLLHTQPA